MDLRNDLIGLGILLAYFLLFAGSTSLISYLARGFFKEGARKAYHVGFSLSIFILLYAFSTWYTAVLAMGVILLVAFIVVAIAEKRRVMRSISINRRLSRFEVLYQIGYVFITFSLLLFIFWGLMGPDFRYIAALGVAAWGLGDASAALIGKKFGGRHFPRLWFNPPKSWEGFLGMTAASGLGIFFVLLLFSPLPLIYVFLFSLLLGSAAAFIEAISRKGTDTLTVPLAVSALAAPILFFFS